MDDVYKTLGATSPEILFKDRKSKFYGYAFPVTTTEEIKSFIDQLRKKHHTANHVCYAWQLGVANKNYRANDDGEPKNSAGMPIYGQIQAFDITNVLVAVVRIFGGTKLGVGGLIQAYKTTAQMTLETSMIVEKLVESHLQLDFDYRQMDKVMRTIKKNRLALISQKMELKCTLIISVRKSEVKAMLQVFNEMQYVEVKSLN